MLVLKQIRELVEIHLNSSNFTVYFKEDNDLKQRSLCIRITSTHQNIISSKNLEQLLYELKKKGFVQNETNVMWVGRVEKDLLLWCVAKDKS